jgi:alpha-N-arabinofuranosidase
MSEAAYMTGLERNADVVYMCSYAPLFAHVDAWQWTPDLIWYDNLKSFGTANYYVQKLYANNKGTDLLVAAKEGKPLIGGEGLYASSVWDANTNEVILKVVNVTDKPITQKFNLKSKKKAVGGKQMLLKGENLDALNSLDQPTKVSPVEQTVEIKGNQPSLTIPAQSLSVFRIKMK